MSFKLKSDMTGEILCSAHLVWAKTATPIEKQYTKLFPS